MDSARWARVKELFCDALERAPDERASFLQDACAGDQALREAVEAMLAQQLRADAAAFLVNPALEDQAGELAQAMKAAGGPPSEQAAVPPVATFPSARVASDPAAAPHRRRATRSRPPWWMVVLAAIFLADCLVRIYCQDFGPEGIGVRTRPADGHRVVDWVEPGGFADRAGLAPGDVLRAFEGRSVEPQFLRRLVQPNLELGRVYRLDVEREGQRLVLQAQMRRVRVLERQGFEVYLGWQLGELMLLGTAFLVAFKRPRDPVARVGALMLATISIGQWLHNLPPGYAAAWRTAPWGASVLLWIPDLCVWLLGPIGLTFFVSFPRALFRSRWPWVVIWLPALLFVPANTWSLFHIVHRPAEIAGLLMPEWAYRAQRTLFGVYGLAMLGAAGLNYARLKEAAEKRRLRVLVAGGVAGAFPALFRYVVGGLAPGSRLGDALASPVPDMLIAAGFLLFPVSFAYAVLRHRLLGIRVIVRLGLKYALARGFLISVVPALGVALIVDALVHGDRPLIEIVWARGWVYGTLAVLAVAAHTQRRRWAAAIDRRFFRDQYDARLLLREVADQARRAGTLERAAPAVVARIEAALHPEFAALMFRASGERAFHCMSSMPSGLAPAALDAASWPIATLRASSAPLSLSQAEAGAAGGDGGDGRDDEDAAVHHTTRPDLLVPISMGPDGHEALLAFGRKRSEEPYTGDDEDALAAIASNLALLLEETPRRAARPASGFEECPRCGACYDTGAALCERERVPLETVGMPRTLVGRYRLERRLGRGGMGTVYEATDVALQRSVAVKVIRDEWVSNPAAARRFRREARAVAGLGHPNVVTVHDYGLEAGTRAFIVMELLHGGTLREEIGRAGALPPARTVEVLRGICAAVDAAHQGHIVHRDLKPENVFLACGDSGGEVVKVLDFGVAKPLQESEEPLESGVESQTEAGVLVGTIGYIGPEQLLGERPAISWDLWALAVVAYECLTGTLPFPVAPRDAWRTSVLAARFTPLSAHRAIHPPAAWQALFARAFDSDPSGRPRAAAEFLRDLERALALSEAR
jgi:eukaryotic-like serine/threonine-protein kinase